MRSPPSAALALLVLAAALATGCALTRHTAEPYRSDPTLAERVEQRAARRCDLEPLPERPFATDACTAWPDGPWRHCCVAHDMAYWCGGPAEARRRADRELRECVASAVEGGHGAVLAALVYAGVRLGGPPWLPTRGHWGYGRGWPRCYDDPGQEADEASLSRAGRRSSTAALTTRPGETGPPVSSRHPAPLRARTGRPR